MEEKEEDDCSMVLSSMLIENLLSISELVISSLIFEKTFFLSSQDLDTFLDILATALIVSHISC